MHQKKWNYYEFQNSIVLPNTSFAISLYVLSYLTETNQNIHHDNLRSKYRATPFIHPFAQQEVINQATDWIARSKLSSALDDRLTSTWSGCESFNWLHYSDLKQSATIKINKYSFVASTSIKIREKRALRQLHNKITLHSILPSKWGTYSWPNFQ